MSTDVQTTLQTLTSMPNTTQPLLSVYIDWMPDGNGQRPQIEVLERDLETITERYRGEPADWESIEADRQRILDYLNTDAPANARSLAIFACSGADLWEALPLQVEVETSVAVAHYPYTSNLARILDEYETYAIVLADGQESRILVVSLNEAERAGEAQASEPIKRFEAGGWAQMLFQRRTENIIKAHTKELAEKLERVIKRHGVQHVIIAANDSIKGTVMASLSDTIKDKLVDVIRMDLTSDIPAIVAATEPMMREVELAQEAAALAELEGEVRGQNLGVAGISDTAMALTKGQVRTLIMRHDFLGTGGECPNCGAIRPGLRPNCPYDGAEMEQIDLREIFTTRAIQQGAELQFVEDGGFLDEHEGIGAVLRYRDTAPAQAV